MLGLLTQPFSENDARANVLKSGLPPSRFYHFDCLRLSI
jgi:hypothetical protein